MARGDAIDIGGNAERLLNDPHLKAAFLAVETDIVDAISTIALTGEDTVNMLVVEKVRDLQANRRLKQKLGQFLAHGHFEARNQDDAERKVTRAEDPRWR